MWHIIPFRTDGRFAICGPFLLTIKNSYLHLIGGAHRPDNWIFGRMEWDGPGRATLSFAGPWTAGLGLMGQALSFFNFGAIGQALLGLIAHGELCQSPGLVSNGQ